MKIVSVPEITKNLTFTVVRKLIANSEYRTAKPDFHCIIILLLLIMECYFKLLKQSYPFPGNRFVVIDVGLKLVLLQIPQFIT